MLGRLSTHLAGREASDVRILGTLIVASVAAVIGAVVAFVSVSVYYLDARPDLQVWHNTRLHSEYTAGATVKTFPQYLELESRLFAELDERIYGRMKVRDKRIINRYVRGSIADPSRWPTNWNRTFELRHEKPRAGVLLLHGMSDSPYTMRALGERLNAGGAWVVGLRMPGHGTVPSALTTVTWRDMAGAVRIATQHLHTATGGAPLFIVGYSTGAALAVDYTLRGLTDAGLAPPAGLVLISPAIGVTPVAALAVWQARLGRLLGLDKLAWSDLKPEYDPFKYGSFAVNAGDQVYRLTLEIADELEQLNATGALRRFPPVLVFQSALDATVSTHAVTANFLSKLPGPKGELVLFDLNRITEIEPLLTADPALDIDALLSATALPFKVSVVTNETRDTRHVVLKSNQAGRLETTELPGLLSWPPGVFSLSHLALAISPSDPLYARDATELSPGIQLGNLSPQGERDALRVPAADMLRLRWNPFYSFLEARVVEFVLTAEPSVSSRAGFTGLLPSVPSS
jgi:alpha-beta hydrolase superfamily lysophospholipase